MIETRLVFILSAAVGRFLKNAWNKEPVILVSCGIGLVGQFTATEVHILWRDTTAGKHLFHAANSLTFAVLLQFHSAHLWMLVNIEMSRVAYVFLCC